MARADTEEMKRLGLKALRFVADTTEEVELLREIAKLSLKDNEIYIQNRNLLKSSESDTWQKKQRLIKALRKWEQMN